MPDLQQRRAYVIGPFGDGSRTKEGALPYGAHHLHSHGFAVEYADPSASALIRDRTARLLVKAVHRLTRAPALAPVLEPGRALRADLLVCVFEDNLSLLAPMVRLRRGGRRSVLLVCWLTESVRAMSGAQRRRWRRRLMAFDHVLVFSTNQVPILEGGLQLPTGFVRMVPFGVSDATTPSDDLGTPDQLVLTVGTDRGRDFATFVAALRDYPGRVTILTNGDHRRRLGDVAPIEVVGPVPRDAYLQLLRRAEIVVSPTLSLAYPTGQTALLEAMRMGKPCVVTRSPALADYVTDGVDVLLVPPGDAAALRSAVDTLRDSPELRERLGKAARATAARFTEPAMWAAIADAAGK